MVSIVVVRTLLFFSILYLVKGFIFTGKLLNSIATTRTLSQKFSTIDKVSIPQSFSIIVKWEKLLISSSAKKIENFKKKTNSSLIKNLESILDFLEGIDETRKLDYLLIINSIQNIVKSVNEPLLSIESLQLNYQEI